MEKALNELNEQERKLLNQVARERMKHKLLADIRTDMMICDMEGWDATDYLNEIKEMINTIGNNK